MARQPQMLKSSGRGVPAGLGVPEMSGHRYDTVGLPDGGPPARPPWAGVGSGRPWTTAGRLLA